jgi:hypothetical protein
LSSGKGAVGIAVRYERCQCCTRVESSRRVTRSRENCFSRNHSKLLDSTRSYSISTRLLVCITALYISWRDPTGDPVIAQLPFQSVLWYQGPCDRADSSLTGWRLSRAFHNLWAQDTWSFLFTHGLFYTPACRYQCVDISRVSSHDVTQHFIYPGCSAKAHAKANQGKT